MNDILPAQTPLWQFFEAQVKLVFDQYGYQEIRMPIAEKTDLFCRSIGEATDVGCDGGQHMVTGQHQTVFGVIETQVIGRVARCVDGHPRTTCQRDLLGVAKRNVWSGCLREVNPNTYA